MLKFQKIRGQSSWEREIVVKLHQATHSNWCLTLTSFSNLYTRTSAQLRNWSKLKLKKMMNFRLLEPKERRNWAKLAFPMTEILKFLTDSCWNNLLISSQQIESMKSMSSLNGISNAIFLIITKCISQIVMLLSFPPRYFSRNVWEGAENHQDVFLYLIISSAKIINI